MKLSKGLLRVVYARTAYRLPLVRPVLERFRIAQARHTRRHRLDQLERHRREGKAIVHFLHIGKTGGTAVKEALRHHTTLGDQIVALHLHHWTLRDVPPGEKVVFFLRDPISRYLSGFLNQQRQGLPQYFSAWTPDERRAFTRFSTPNDLALSLSSEDPEVRAAAQRAMKAIKHVRSGFWHWFGDPDYFDSRLQDILFVGFQERLGEDFKRLKTILALPESVRLPRDDARAHRSPRDADKHLDDEAIENLLAWYAADYRFLDFCRVNLGVHPPQSPYRDRISSSTAR